MAKHEGDIALNERSTDELTISRVSLARRPFFGNFARDVALSSANTSHCATATAATMSGISFIAPRPRNERGADCRRRGH